MLLRFLALLLVVAVAGAFAQTGLFGPVSVRLKAGDLAPSFKFTKILSSEGRAPWSPPDFSQAMTVLMFFPDMSHNLEHVTRWNELAARFSDKPVQFAWITSEKEGTLIPWIEQHPVKGWVLLDAEGITGRSYGMEEPSTAIIGTDGRIIGFGNWTVPEAQTITAALEGRITTALPTRDMAELMTFAKSGKVLLLPEPTRMHRPGEDKPDFEPSYIVHISPAKNEASLHASGPDYDSLKAFTLKELIVELYDVPPIRIQLPAALDDGKRYEVTLVLPERETHEQMYSRFRQGIQDYFHFTAKREKRLMDVYVVTAPDGKPPALKTPDPPAEGTIFSASNISFESRERVSQLADLQKPMSIDALQAISMAGSMDEFCRLIEDGLDRPVVNETNLNGAFEFSVATSTGKNDFLQRLRAQLGIAITTSQRTVEVLVIQPL